MNDQFWFLSLRVAPLDLTSICGHIKGDLKHEPGKDHSSNQNGFCARVEILCDGGICRISEKRTRLRGGGGKRLGQAFADSDSLSRCLLFLGVDHLKDCSTKLEMSKW